MKKFLCLLVVLSSCSFKNKQLENQKLKGHEELYSEPSEVKRPELEKTERRIVIASTNDLHGNYRPAPVAFKDETNRDQTIQIGGQEVIAQYFNILRDTYKDVVLVDSGDIFSNSESLAEVRSFYQKNEYDAVTVGLRDFNLKVSSKLGNNSKMFQEFSKTSSTPLIMSNLYELKTARGVEWEGVKSHLMKEVNGVKVGLIGIIPDDIVEQTPVNNRVGLFVENMLQATLRHARLLRSLGADVIVVMTHQSINCGVEQAEEMKLPVSKVNFEPLHESVCDLKNQLGTYLERLPPHLVDVVIGGRNDHKIANAINGTYVMASFPDGKSFNYIEFVVDTKAKKIVKEKTQLHQPVMFCHEFFKETSDCYYEDPSVDHKKRIPATFLGKEIVPSVNMGTARLETNLKEHDLKKKMSVLNADLSYVTKTSGETQLFIVTLTGQELSKLLEQEYNHGKTGHWIPTPFQLKKDKLTITIQEKEIDLQKSYRILTDMESIQNHRKLVKKVNVPGSEALTHLSWNQTDLTDRMPASPRIELTNL